VEGVFMFSKRFLYDSAFLCGVYVHSLLIQINNCKIFLSHPACSAFLWQKWTQNSTYKVIESTKKSGFIAFFCITSNLSDPVHQE